MRLVGSAAPFNGPPIDINREQSNSEGVAGSKTLLMSTKQSGKPKLSKIKVTEQAYDASKQQMVTQTGGVLANLKSVKLSPEE